MILRNKFFFLFLFSMIFTACSSASKLDADEIQSIKIKPKEGAKINFGKAFQADVIAVMKSGKEVNISESKRLKIDGINFDRKTKIFNIEPAHPSSFNDTLIPISITFENKGVARFSETIALNFEGGHYVNMNGSQGGTGEDGENGAEPRNKLSERGLSQTGKNGHLGHNGQTGTTGGEIKIRVWKKDEVFYLYATDFSDTFLWRYMTTASAKIQVNVNGGTGGTGGQGGKGGQGKDGYNKVIGGISSPGAGGRGGAGGTGGNGGKGGDIIIVRHPSATAGNFSSSFVYSVSGGSGGHGGAGGIGGDSGVPHEKGQNNSIGEKGTNGHAGYKGEDGTFSSIEENFDYSIYMKEE